MRYPLCLLGLLLSVGAIADPVKVACVGDSITFGAGVTNREKEAYPAVLGELLGANYAVWNFGVSGATLLKKGNKPYWLEAAYAKAKGLNPDIVVIMLGTNDSKPVNWQYSSAFPSDLTALVDSFQALPSHPKVWLCQPTPSTKNKYRISEGNEQQVRRIIAQVAATKKLGVIDIDHAFDGHADLFLDGVHPNNAGAKLMAQTVAAALVGK